MNLKQMTDGQLEQTLKAYTEQRTSAENTATLMRKREAELKERADDQASKRAKLLKKLDECVTAEQAARMSRAETARMADAAQRRRGHAKQALDYLLKNGGRIELAVAAALRDMHVAGLAHDGRVADQAIGDIVCVHCEQMIARLDEHFSGKIQEAEVIQKRRESKATEASQALAAAELETSATRQQLEDVMPAHAEIQKDLKDCVDEAELAEMKVRKADEDIPRLRAELEQRRKAANAKT